MYMGGLAAAVRSIDGASPELIVTNTRDPGRPEMTAIDKFIGAEFRSRYVNPTWIEGMQREGYAGAGEMRAFVEYLWGWDATVTCTRCKRSSSRAPAPSEPAADLSRLRQKTGQMIRFVNRRPTSRVYKPPLGRRGQDQ